MAAKRMIHKAECQTGLSTLHTAKVYQYSADEFEVVFLKDGKQALKDAHRTSNKIDAIGTADYYVLRMSEQYG